MSDIFHCMLFRNSRLIHLKLDSKIADPRLLMVRTISAGVSMDLAYVSHGMVYLALTSDLNSSDFTTKVNPKTG